MHSSSKTTNRAIVFALADPDSFVRWQLVESAVSGDGVRIHWMTEATPHTAG
jgi:hypothetical protein